MGATLPSFLTGVDFAAQLTLSKQQFLVLQEKSNHLRLLEVLAGAPRHLLAHNSRLGGRQVRRVILVRRYPMSAFQLLLLRLRFQATAVAMMLFAAQLSELSSFPPAVLRSLGELDSLATAAS